jgi:hypothetical protein
MNTLHPIFAGLTLEGVAGGGWGWVWLALLVAGAGFLYWTYRGIFQRTESRLTWTLMTLRGLGLLLLVLALAKPTWTRETDQIDPGRVAVILDNSRSMTLPDASGSPRYDRARAAVDAFTKALNSGSGPRAAVDLFDINGVPLKDGMPAKPDVDRTDLGRAIQRTVARSRSGLLLGVVIVSDGMDNTGRASFRDWEDGTHPIHGIGFPQTETGDLDLAIERPQVQPRVRIQHEVPVKVVVSKTGQGGAKAKVFLRRGKEVLASKDITFGGGKGAQEVDLNFVPREPGSFVLTAAVEAASGEKYLGNNAQHFPIRVDAEPIKIFYLEGFLRYEYKYLKERLEDDPDVELRTHVRREAPDASARPDKDFPSEKELNDYQVVILGDMEGSFLTLGEAQRLVKWLDGKNHSLLVLGGYQALGPDGLAKTPLGDLLPLSSAGPAAQVEDSFRLKLTPEGQKHPLFTLMRDPVKDAEVWNTSPPLLGMALATKVKPDAEVLAVNPQVMQDGKPAPVLAVRRAGGGGHIMVLTADSTWRWSRVPRLLGQPDVLYTRFWAQGVRWLAGRDLDDERPLLSVTTDQPSYDTGKKVTVVVRRQPKPGSDLSGAQPSADIRDPAGRVVPLILRGDSKEPDKFSGDYFPAIGGRYEVIAGLDAAGKSLANQAAEFQVQGQDVELADTSTNPRNLYDLAAATGGAFVEIDHAADLAGKIERKERRTVTEKRSEYWNSPWLFLGFLGLVTGEWFLRRRNHLV